MVAELVEHAQTRQEPSSRPGQARAEAGPAEAAGLRTYVVDTSVALSDPRALAHFAEHEVVLPLVVVSELEAKRADPDLGYYARTAPRLLDDLRGRHGALDQPVPITPEGGTPRIELNHVSVDVRPWASAARTTTPASSPSRRRSRTRAPR